MTDSPHAPDAGDSEAREAPLPERTGTEQGLTGAPVTAALLAANIGVFLAQVSLAGDLRFLMGGMNRDDHARWNMILRVLGANDAAFTIADTRLETLVTSCFLHGSILHLGFNLLALWQVGPFLERSVGRARFLPLYVASGIVGSAFSAISGRFLGASISVGASGAICGIMGAILVLGVRTQGWRGPLARQMGAWLAFAFVLGVAKNFQGGVQVDNAAHLGGALGGAILAAAWRRGMTYGKQATDIVVGICVTTIMATGVVQLVRTRTDPYLYMTLEQRMSTAFSLARSGKCEEADRVFKRALQMDPNRPTIRTLGAEIDRECLAPRRPNS